jgi:phenylacetate-CoA ligase
MTIDSLEARTHAEREKDLMHKLSEQVEFAKEHAPYFAQLLSPLQALRVDSREALSRLPVTRKSQLSAAQKQNPPFGGMNASPLSAIKRIFQSPGPIHEPQGFGADPFRLARALRACGFESGDLVHNTFSYHFTPGAWMLEAGAHALGCTVFPAGVGQTELQAQTIAHLRPNAYTGTPSFLKIILEKADELSLDSSSIKKAVVSGEALTPSMRVWFQTRGITVTSTYATADVGLIAYETPELGSSGMVIDENIVLEIVEPGGTQPMPIGEVGEVVVTVFDRDYPLVRFGTGDLSAIDPDSVHTPAPCGRRNLRIKGWLGRADQTTKIKGMFVHPNQVMEIVKKHAQVAKARVVVSGNIGSEQMTLLCELKAEATSELDALNQAIVNSTKELTKLRAQVSFVDTLPSDGVWIEDARTYA